MFHGFTLVELLVTIAVSSIIITVGITALNPGKQISRGNDAKRKADLLSIQTALERYYADNGDYPPIGSTTWCTQLSSTEFTDVKNSLETEYMNKVPQDPKFAGTDKDYFYWHYGSGRYRLYAVLENTDDPDVVEGALVSDGGVGGCTGANSNYNFRLVNP